ncbi:MAG: beta-ketoacyl-[acyl-carrier-protein] synthase family protein [Verrucomicrobia bacterium]|nr:beta-ketoacyl-[acyl-carrier-protein] synthase family protein [Verrucomicrobiota bacterium]MCH8511555.1 beta-ketoacyl-[acyl-carrier-protein] synthase family protein [Kiritimatiellia bacterium]
MYSPNSRVVITGIGVLAPTGNSLPAFWEASRMGTSGIGRITLFDVSDFPITMAGEVKGFDLNDYMEPDGVTQPKRLARHSLLGLAAAHMAVRNADFDIGQLRQAKGLAIQMGLSTGAIDVIERGKEVLARKGPTKVSPHIVNASLPHALSNALAASFGVACARGTHSSACPSGMEAVARGAELIHAGKADMVLAGGADAPITPLTMSSLVTCGLALECPLPAEKASRPFDAKRSCGLIAEGGCVLVLERLDHALDRGAEPLAEILGHGEWGDTPGGVPADGLATAMRMALTDAGLLPMDIDYINAHGPSHPLLDRLEVSRIKEVFGERAYQVPVSSLKGGIGNPFAAAGPMQIAVTALAIREGIVPPTANYDFPDPDCDLNVVPNDALPMPLRHCLVNMHGLGGGNSCMVLGKVGA